MKPLLPLALAACTLATCALAGCSPPPGSTPPPAAAFPAKLRALGTEPFWSLDIDGARFAYSTADIPARMAKEATRSEAGGALVLAGTLGDEAIAVRVTRESCSDGMSDRAYPFAVRIRLGAGNLAGCAF